MNRGVGELGRLGAAEPNPGRDPVQPLPDTFADGLLRLEALKSMERVKR